jgi:hypothetical protein
MRFWRRRRILSWAAAVFAAAAVGASTAQAMPVVEQEGGTAKVSPPVQAPSGGGFDWMYVEVSIAGASGLIVLAGGALAVRRSRSGQPARA